MTESHAILTFITLEQLHKALDLPVNVRITHAQARGLAPEIFLRIEHHSFPEVAPGARLESRTMILNEDGKFEDWQE